MTSTSIKVQGVWTRLSFGYGPHLRTGSHHTLRLCQRVDQSLDPLPGMRKWKHIATLTPTTNIQHPAKCQRMGVIPHGLRTSHLNSGAYGTQLEAMDWQNSSSSARNCALPFSSDKILGGRDGILSFRKDRRDGVPEAFSAGQSHFS